MTTLLAALATVHLTADVVQDQTAWQRFSAFLVQSEGMVVFTALAVLIAAPEIAPPARRASRSASRF